MNIKIEDNILKVSLEPECTIVNVVRDHAALAQSVKHPIKKIELSVEGVAEIDTAYLQLLLSLKAAAVKLQIPVELTGSSEKVGEICSYYGISF